MIRQKKSIWDDIYQNKSIPLLAARKKQLRLHRETQLLYVKMNESFFARKKELALAVIDIGSK